MHLKLTHCFCGGVRKRAAWERAAAVRTSPTVHVGNHMLVRIVRAVLSLVTKTE